MDDLKLIKKHYGEKMSHLCRDLFPTILEIPGLLFDLLSNSFNYSKFLCDDLISNDLVNDFKDYIYDLVKHEESSEKLNINKNPYELMEEAGYTLYRCKTEDDIQNFKKYYAPGEKLCTFYGGRLDTCDVFFAVKKNVAEIKREDFPNPERQDEYGTSVISIQFSKGSSNYLSIKNRYNHTVVNPDATFSNNLDNIFPGLAESFRNYFKYNIQTNNHHFEIPNYVRTFEGKYYKYNYECGIYYYCSNNVVIEGGKLKKEYLDKNRYLVFDYFILDLKEKKITCFNSEYYYDSFADVINDLDIEKIEVIKNKEGKEIILKVDCGKIVITLDKQNRIISYYDDINVVLPNNYFSKIAYINNEIVLNNVAKINHDFIGDEQCTIFNLKKFYAPNLESIGNNFMCPIEVINSFYAPKLKIVGDSVLTYCTLKQYDLSNLEVAGINFLSRTISKEIYFPKLELVGDGFLEEARCTESINLPDLRETGKRFAKRGLHLRSINTPRLYKIGEESLRDLPFLEEIDFPKIQLISDKCLKGAVALKKLNIPYVIEIGRSVLYENECLEYLNAPLVNIIDAYFLGDYKKLNYININKKAIIDHNFAGLDNASYFIPSIGFIIGNENIIYYIDKAYQKYDKENSERIHFFLPPILDEYSNSNDYDQSISLRRIK